MTTEVVTGYLSVLDNLVPFASKGALAVTENWTMCNADPKDISSQVCYFWRLVNPQMITQVQSLILMILIFDLDDNDDDDDY